MTDLRVINGIPEGLATYVRRPLAVEAVQLTEDVDWDVIATWCGGIHRVGRDITDEAFSFIAVSDDTAWEDDWILKWGPDDFRVVRAEECDGLQLIPRDELSRIVNVGVLAGYDFHRGPQDVTSDITNAVVQALLSGKSSSQLASEATNGQEGGDQ